MQRNKTVFWALCLAILVQASSVSAATCSRAIRIMPLGDSITAGLSSSGLPEPGFRVSYRQDLYNALTAAGYEIDYVGSQLGGDQVVPPFDPDHEGLGGIRDDQVAVSVFPWLEAAAPDYILLHIGTNALDVNPADVEQILNEIDRYSLNPSVVLARIINQRSYKSKVTQFNDNVAAMASQRIVNGDRIDIVDMESALDYAVDMEDTLHPNTSGYTKMAQVWETKIQELLSARCSGVPQFISPPVARVGLGDTYYYQADVIGAGPVQFTLTAAPAGMTINPDTGLVSWLPSSTGTTNVSISVTGPSGVDTQGFSVDVAPQVILDNGDAGTSSTGAWLVSSGVNPYGVDSVYSENTGDTYTFSVPAAGVQEVSLWWTIFSNRNTSVPVDIYDGNTLIDTVTVNQQEGGNHWNVLGNYAFTGQASIVIRASGSGTASADAVRLIQVDVSMPLITSAALVQGSVGAPYSYDVDALGDPVPGYSLLTAPVGMTIDPVTGVIDWTPSTVGSYAVTVEANNSNGTDTQSFTIDVNDPSLELIIDNDDPGTSSSGTWSVSSGVDPYGTDSLYSKKAGDSYTFTVSISGYQEVSLWWTILSSRETAVPVEIYDGTTLLDTVTVNQQQGGNQWNVMGQYLFNGQARIVIRSISTNSTSADAVRLAPIDVSIPLVTSAPVVQGSIAIPYSYDVDALGDPVPGYSLLTAPAGMTIDPVTGVIDWTPSTVGSYAVTVEANNSNGTDTQSFTIDVNDPSLELIIDNDDPGTSSSGTWSVSSGVDPYGTDSLYSRKSGGSYTFTASMSGYHEVSLWWTIFSNRETAVPVEIYDGTTLLDTVTVDQQQGGNQWNVLGQYLFNGQARIVIRSISTNSTSADAVRLVPIDVSLPLVTSTPLLDGLIGMPYSYDVDALGDPAPGYQLLSAPAGMSIDPVTGVIDWTPTAAGSVSVTVEASNANGSDSQTFTIQVDDPLLGVIIDNGDSNRISSTGTWKVSSATGPYGADSVYSRKSGDSFTFDLAMTGTIAVSMWWTEHSNRETTVPVDIYDGTVLLDTVIVNQRLNGSQWMLLGGYTFTDRVRVVIRSTSSDSTCADAVKLVLQ